MKFKDKVMVVTGAGSGIGRELVLQLSKLGATIAAIDINAETLNETLHLLEKNTENISLHVVNITDKPKVDQLPKEIIAIHGKIDGLINNAGIIQPFVKIHDLDYDAINRVMDVNFYGSLYMIKAFLPYLLERPEAYLANVSSMGGFLPVPGQSIYGAAKAAVKLMTESLTSELAETNVHVSVIFPGAIATNISDNSGVQIVSENRTEEESKIEPLPAPKAAKIIIKGMQKEKARIFVGKDSKMMNFLYSLNANWARKLITKQMGDLLE